jgi:obg-like ATPase 1
MSKKKEPQEIPIILGRTSNSLRLGIVGLPNVGKSTLFNILTRLSVPAENFPFCTIDPNEARVNVPDERFDWLCQFHKPVSKVPPVLQVTDIAGLIRGASKGEGLGNAFLSHIRAVDGIAEVVRVFEDTEITHVEDSVDPVRDMEIILGELIEKDIDTAEKARETAVKNLRGNEKNKSKQLELEVITKICDMLKERQQVRFGDWKVNEVDIVNNLTLLTAKPVIYLVNMSEADYIKKGNKWLPKIKKWIDENGGGPIVPFCGAMEKKLLDMEDDARAKYLQDYKTSSAIPKIIKTGYEHLQLVHFFTCGSDEVKCWTIRKYTKAPEAAGIIHTDFEKGFICAEVMKYDEFKELGSEAAVKAAGKYRQEGKNYIVQDGDIIFFKANTVGLKK